MAGADVACFPAADDVAGRLKLRGSEGLGPNPWTAARPAPEAFGLTAADLDDDRFHKARRAIDFELRQLGARVVSAFLLPLSVVGGAYYFLVGQPDLTMPPPFDWTSYLAASLVLAAIGARLQTLQHRRAREARDGHVSIGDRRTTMRAAERDWIEEQRRRTTTSFWIDDIKTIAAETGVDNDDAFAQEVAKLFVAWGWDVKLNQRSHDYGVDVFASGRDGSAVVQCKHGLESGPAASDIRDLAGSRHAFNADYGLLISILPPTTSRQNEFFSDKAQLEYWHLGHILEQCIVLYKKRTGQDAPEDDNRKSFLTADGTPLVRHAEEREAAE
jgi:hypothetical protein